MRRGLVPGPMARNAYWMDALLVVVTLGFYIPYWFWRRNRDLREAWPELGLPQNVAFLAAGVTLSLLGSLTGFLDLPFLGSALVMAGVLVFSAGVFVLLRNGEAAAEGAGTSWRVPPALGAGLFGAAFVAVEVGNVLPSLLVRGPALLLVLTLPLAFYYVHEDLEDAHAAAEARAPKGPSAWPAS